MSIAAIDAAWGIDVSPPARKLVLLCMANRHNGITGQLNPSVDDVARSCGISADQARRHIHALIDAGLVEVIGNHYGGKPGMSRSYRLNLAITPCTDATPSTDAAHDLHPCGRGLAPMQLTAGTHASQTRKNQNEPEDNQKYKRAERADIQRPDSVPVQVWSDFLAIRKAKRAPLTATALDGIKSEATKAGMALADVLTLCCTRGWQSFKAEWIESAKANSPARKVPARENFETIDYGNGIRAL